MVAKVEYKKSFAKEIREWLLAGKHAQSWFKSKGFGRDVYYRFLKEFPDFEEAVEYGRNSRGFKFKKSYIKDCEKAITSEMGFEDFRKSLGRKWDDKQKKYIGPEVPIPVIFFWEEKHPEFTPSVLVKACGNQTIYRKVYEKLLIDHMASGKSPSSFCAELGIARHTFHAWVNRHPSMKKAYQVAKEKSQRFFEEIAIDHATGELYHPEKPEWRTKSNIHMLKFMMERRFADYNPSIPYNEPFDDGVETETKKPDISVLSVDEIVQFTAIMQKLEAQREKVRKEKLANGDASSEVDHDEVW